MSRCALVGALGARHRDALGEPILMSRGGAFAPSAQARHALGVMSRGAVVRSIGARHRNALGVMSRGAVVRSTGAFARNTGD